MENRITMERTMPADTQDSTHSVSQAVTRGSSVPTPRDADIKNNILGWIKLLMAKGLGLADKRALISGMGNPEEFFDTENHRLSELLRLDSARIREIKSIDLGQVEQTLSVMEQNDIGFLPFSDSAYPALLGEISSAPLGLFYRGILSLINAAQLAIVGSRNPTPTGIRTAEEFAGELSANNLIITSGLAEGIDSAAHRGCLKAGGNTIAVVATGLDITYPRSNQALSDQIAESGLLISEFLPGTTPRREYFPQRNRLISGLSLGTLVVEASLRSGSLITARSAGEQGREVFAIPGSIHVPTSRGCHFLIRNGAKLVETTKDILDEMGKPFKPIEQAAVNQTDEAIELEKQVFALYSQIDFTPVSIDQLIDQSGLTAEEVSYILMTLELKGLIASTPTGYQRLPE